MSRVVEFLRNQPARVYGLAVAVLALLTALGVVVPVGPVLGVVAALLALFGGEVVQRVENRKSIEAVEYGYDGALYSA